MMSSRKPRNRLRTGRMGSTGSGAAIGGGAPDTPPADGSVTGRSSEERVFSLSLFVAGSVSLVFPFVSGFIPLLVTSFVLGLGFGCCAPLSMVLSYNRAPHGRSGEAIGLRQTVNKSIEASAPAIFGFVSAAFGFVPVYWIGALLLGCGGWLMHSDARRKAVIK